MLLRSKEVFTQTIEVTCHDSCYFIINTTANINFFIKLLFEIKIVDTQLGRDADRTEFKDLYI